MHDSQSFLRCPCSLRFMNMQRKDELPHLLGPGAPGPLHTPPGRRSRATRRRASCAASLLPSFPTFQRFAGAPGPKGPAPSSRGRGEPGELGCRRTRCCLQLGQRSTSRTTCRGASGGGASPLRYQYPILRPSGSECLEMEPRAV
ncbi:uncharacterized protein AAES06_022056 isoform 2-T2 [Glossophaga mutica]